MNQDYIIPDQWSIIEEGFEPERVQSSESLFSLGNGAMGQRANFVVGFESALGMMWLPTPSLSRGSKRLRSRGMHSLLRPRHERRYKEEGNGAE